MNKENRKHPRFYPSGLMASISIEPPAPEKKLVFKGTVIDMSPAGIKIKLTTPLNINAEENTIMINLTLPESGVPVTIRGVIKHLTNDSEYGFQYSDNNTNHEVDNLILECIKLANKDIHL